MNGHGRPPTEARKSEAGGWSCLFQKRPCSSATPLVARIARSASSASALSRSFRP